MLPPNKLEIWFDQTGVFQRVLAELCGTQQSRISKFVRGTGTLPVHVAEQVVRHTRRLGRKTPGVVRITMRDLMEGCPYRLLKSLGVKPGDPGDDQGSS